jgi:hypothetical protein
MKQQKVNDPVERTVHAKQRLMLARDRETVEHNEGILLCCKMHAAGRCH